MPSAHRSIPCDVSENFVIELGDFVSLTHPKLLNLKTGTLGISNVLCEVIDGSRTMRVGW